MSVELVRRHFTVEEYHRMSEAGVFGADERIELLEGEICQMAPIGSAHAACVKRLNDLFAERVRPRALIGVQDPVRMGGDSEPQPDLTLLRLRQDFYAGQHPGPEDVFLAVEVACSSLAVDRRVKVPLYGRHGIPEAWIVNLDEGRLEVCRDPAEDGYRQIWLLGRGKSVTLLAFPDVEVTVDELLG
jgi:Uma2 family endonuclease